ncbi:MAG TPA: alkaline phosphatase family protein [Tepidisphaeraceae bacterium]|jgi:hypothetical protein
MSKIFRRVTCAAGVLALGFAAQSALANGPYQHVLLLSLDGLHAADLTDPATAQYLPDVLDLASHGVTYSNAYAVKPTDNFPNMIAQVTGAGPKTSGIYYDDTYRRNYYPAFTFPDTPPGASATWTADIDRDSSLINGGGNSDASSINPEVLPQVMVNGVLQRVYPHNDLKVNTVFEVAHNAGLRTAYIDKHPSYEIVSGPSGTELDDFYGPESDARAVLIDGALMDATQAPPGSKFKQISKSIPMSEAYDDMRVDALVNQINGKTSRGAAAGGAPALFGMSFIAVNTAEKDTTSGGVDPSPNGNVANAGLVDALQRTNASVNRIVGALKTSGLYDSTLIVLTAKHGQSPRVGEATNYPNEYLTGALFSNGIAIRQATQDDVSLIWLDDQSKAADAKSIILQEAGDNIEQVLIGDDLTLAGLGNPATDDRAPDLIVKFKPGILLSNSLKRGEHGGFSEDDSHIAMILGGAIPPEFQGLIESDNVLDTQLAPTMLEALGLDPNQLQGVVIDGTTGLPGAPVPEPTMIVGLGVALVGLCGCRRR